MARFAFFNQRSHLLKRKNLFPIAKTKIIKKLRKALKCCTKGKPVKILKPQQLAPYLNLIHHVSLDQTIEAEIIFKNFLKTRGCPWIGPKIRKEIQSLSCSEIKTLQIMLQPPVIITNDVKLSLEQKKCVYLTKWATREKLFE